MSKVTMPEPVAFRWRVPIVDSDGRQCGESDWKYGTEKGGLPWWTRDNLITTTQAEAYAAAKVRESLVQAESILRGNAKACKSLAVKVLLSANADAIGELIPPLPGPASHNQP